VHLGGGEVGAGSDQHSEDVAAGRSAA
jgi:hypothetical protein